jgi:hypothetical protein
MSSPVPADAEERGRLIARRADELCEARSGTDGPDRADWMQAEREMTIVEAIIAAAARLPSTRPEPAAVSNVTSSAPSEPDSAEAGAAPGH